MKSYSSFKTYFYTIIFIIIIIVAIVIVIIIIAIFIVIIIFTLVVAIVVVVIIIIIIIIIIISTHVESNSFIKSCTLCCPWYQHLYLVNHILSIAGIQCISISASEVIKLWSDLYNSVSIHTLCGQICATV